METEPNALGRNIQHLHPSERDLARRAREGDESAYHEMVDRYGAELYRLAFSLLGNAADAEDALQETFMGAFRSLRKFEERSSVRTWLTRILVRQAARCYRSRGRERMISLQALAPSSEEKAACHVETESTLRLDVQEAVQGLPPMHRVVILLREQQGMSYDEIAEVLGVPRGTVESRLFRARQMLREKLKDYLL